MGWWLCGSVFDYVSVESWLCGRVLDYESVGWWLCGRVLDYVSVGCSSVVECWTVY